MMYDDAQDEAKTSNKGKPKSKKDAAACRKEVLERYNALKLERQSWWDHWRELAEQIRPRGSRFLSSEVNKGWKKNDKIINSTPCTAERTLAAGMMSGITSPSRPWFRLTTPDPQLAEQGAVKQWLSKVEDTLRLVMARSNIYNSLHSVYSDLGTHGTACLWVDEDDKSVVRTYTFPVGMFCLDTSATAQIDTVYRELSMTVRQVVDRFGYDACSPQTKTLFDCDNYNVRLQVLHMVEPNTEHQEGKLGPAGKKYRSRWYELSASDNCCLRDEGYDELPAMAPRWNVTGEDVYGDSPGMAALGDCKALQQLEKRKFQAVDKIINPPMRGPSSLQNTRSSLLPGDVTYVDSLSTGSTFAPAMEVPPVAVQIVGQEIRETEARVNRTFFADLWLMLANSDSTMTAREVIERREEKLLQLGTVLERLQEELLDPMISRIFSVCLKRRLLPPPPPVLQGADLRVEYISIMAQAQKLLGTTAVERLLGFVGQIATLKPDVIDKVDMDQTIDEYSTMLGVPPVIIRPDDDVAQVRAARAQEAAQAQQAQQAQAAAQTAQTLAQTPTDGQTALNSMLQGLGVQ